MKKLVWNVYIEEGNQIKEYNIFSHGYFAERVMEIAGQVKSKNKFAERLRSILAYYFWAKSEMEIVMTDRPYISKDELERLKGIECKYRTSVNLEIERKIDVYSQVRMNWDVFVDYVWYNLKIKG